MVIPTANLAPYLSLLKAGQIAADRQRGHSLPIDNRLLDDLVGASEQRWRHRQSNRLRRLQDYDQKSIYFPLRHELPLEAPRGGKMPSNSGVPKRTGETRVWQRCKIYHIYPETSEIKRIDLDINLQDGTRVNLQIGVRTFLNRPNFSMAIQKLGGDGLFNCLLQKETGYWYGHAVVSDGSTGTPIVMIDMRPPNTGELDIFTLFSEQNPDKVGLLRAFSETVLEVGVSFLSIRLAEFLVAVDDRQTLFGMDDGGYQMEQPQTINLMVSPRKQIATDDLINALTEYRAYLTTASLEDLQRLSIAARRLNSAAMESDAVDIYCGLWECCEFLGQPGARVRGIRLKGHKDGAISQALIAHTQSSKPQAVRVKINELYKIRNDIVHNAAENPAIILQNIDILREVAQHLFRFWVQLPYEETREIKALV